MERQIKDQIHLQFGDSFLEQKNYIEAKKPVEQITTSVSFGITREPLYNGQVKAANPGDDRVE